MADANPYAQFLSPTAQPPAPAGDAPAAPEPGGNPYAQFLAPTAKPGAAPKAPDEPLGPQAPGSWGDMGNSAIRTLRDLGHNAATGVVHGGAGVLDQAYSLIGPEYGGNDPGTKLAGKFFEKVMPEYKPATLPGRLFQSGAGGAAVGALGGPLAATYGFLSGAGGQAGGELGAAVGGPVGEAFGGLLGGTLTPGAPGLYAARRGALAKAVQERTQNMTPADWDAAQGLQDRSSAIGVPLMAPEAMNSPALNRFTADVRASRAGSGPIDARLTDRPDQVRAAVNNEVLDPISGQPMQPSKLGPLAQKTATEGLGIPTDKRTAQSAPWFNKAAAQDVTATQLKPILDDLNKAIDIQGEGPTKVKAELVKLRDSIGTQSGIVTNTQIGPIAAQTQDYFNRGKFDPANPDAVSKAVSGAVTPHAQALERALQTNNDYAAGRWSHGVMTPAVDEAQALPLRDIAATDNPKTQTAAIAPADVDISGDIRKTANYMQMSNPKAWPALARNYFETAFNRATKPTQSGENPAMGANFANAVNGTDAQKANNRAMLEGVAQAHGIPASGLIPGFNNAMEILERTARIPGVGSQTAERGNVQAELSKGPGTGLGALNPLKMADKAASIIESAYMNRAYGQFAQAITSPDGVQQLRQLSMLNPQSRQARLLVGTMAGLVSSGMGLEAGQSLPLAPGRQ